MPESTWDERLATDYADASAGMTADIAFYVGLALRAAGPVAELAVGDGRVAIPVALATGKRVTGIDVSPAMLERCAERALAAGADLDLRLGDMSAFTLDEPAALIYCPFHAFLHLPDWASRRRAFECAAASLLPGGRLAWNAMVFDHRIAARTDGVRQDGPAPRTIRYHPGYSQVDMIRDDGAVSTMRWATRNEWAGLIDVAGLELETLHSGFAGEPFGPDSGHFVFTCRRPDRG
jgi:predicted RNA methylase